MSLWLERDSSKKQVFGDELQMLLGSVLLNFLVIAGNLSPITFFDHPSNTKLNGSMDTSESTEVIKEKQTEHLYHKQKNNQIQFRKIIKANAFGKRLLSMRERNTKNISVVVSHELDTFSIKYSSFELFR